MSEAPAGGPGRPGAGIPEGSAPRGQQPLHVALSSSARGGLREVGLCPWRLRTPRAGGPANTEEASWPFWTESQTHRASRSQAVLAKATSVGRRSAARLGTAQPQTHLRRVSKPPRPRVSSLVGPVVDTCSS